MSNSYTKGYLDGNSLTESQLDTAYQTLQLDIANTALTTTGSASGQALTSNGSGVAASFQTIPDPMGPFALRNYGLKATVASGVLTISLKTKVLATPSSTDIVDFNYSTNGTTSAAYTSVQIASATTFSLNASATLGFSTSTSRIFVYGYYNTATASVKLAVAAGSYYDNGGTTALTAVSAAADSSTAIYGTAALTVAPRLLGWVETARNSGGLWQTPSHVNISNNASLNNVVTADKIGSSMSSVGANAVGSSIGAAGANAIVYQVNAASAANIIGNVMGASGANHIGSVMTAGGSNNVVNSIDSGTAANHVLATSSIGSTTDTSTITTSNFTGSFVTKASFTAPATAKYLVFATGSISSSTTSVNQVRISSSPTIIGPTLQVHPGGAFNIMGVQALTSGDTVALQGQYPGGGTPGAFNSNCYLAITRLT